MPSLGFSDHIMVHFIPAYRQKVKLSKPVLKKSKYWLNESAGMSGLH